MGGTLSSSENASSILTTLLSQSCPASHPIWQSFSIYSFSTNEISDKDIEMLIQVRNKRPDNFSELIRFVIDMFSKTAKLSESNEKAKQEIPLFCDTICLLLSISGLPVKISPWFKAPALYLQSITPIHSLIQTIFKLLDMNDSKPEESMHASNIQNKIQCVKTLLFLQHAQAFTTVETPDPSPYLMSFDIFPAAVFLRCIFEMIPLAIKSTRSQYILQYIRGLITIAIPPLYSCATWKNALSSIDQNTIHRAFSVLFIVIESSLNSGLSERVLDCSEQLVSLLYTVIVRYTAYQKFIDINNLAPRYIAALLILFQYRMEMSSITFFHSIVLLTISHLTSDLQSLLALNESFASNFTTKYRPHRGTYIDLIIEIITNPAITDFETAAPLSQLAVGIIENLSSATVHLSFFSANRIFLYLTKFFTKKIAEKPEYFQTIGKLLTAIYQFVRFHLLGNQVIILYGLEKKKIISGLSQAKIESWSEPAKKIWAILEAADLPVRIKNEKERSKALQNALASVLSDYNEPPVKTNAFLMPKEIEVVWYDWFRVMFWQLFPDEAEFYHLNFVSFQIPRAKQAITDNFKETPIEIKSNEEYNEFFDEDNNNSKVNEQTNNNGSEQNNIDNDSINKAENDGEDGLDEETALSIIKSMKPLELKPRKKELAFNMNTEKSENGNNLDKPKKHPKTLEELDNPFGSDDDDELAKFLED